MPQTPLTDGFGRAFQYLRLSIDEACNFKCVYCLPEGFKKSHNEPPLSAEEVRRLVGAFSELGLWKVRLTGGEPTTRKDVVELARVCASTPGIRKVALSTNGYRLAELARPLAEAGVKAVNVSVDSLNKERFARITGHDKLDIVLKGVEASLAAGLETKINVVMLKDLNDSEFEGFLEWTRITPVSIRFIELMKTGDNGEFFNKRHLSSSGLAELLSQRGWIERQRLPGDGPAMGFRRPGFAGSAGLITPYSTDFCATCNRLRVTSRGRLRLCLFSEGEASLRDLLQDDSQKPSLQTRLREILAGKLASHDLARGRTGSARHFALMGG